MGTAIRAGLRWMWSWLGRSSSHSVSAKVAQDVFVQRQVLAARSTKHSRM